jgi:hypothetical protein
MTRYATTKQEAAVNARLDAFMSGQRQKAERGEETGSAWRPVVDPLGRFISGALGSPAETVDRSDDPAMSAGYLRLTDREREDLGSASPMVAAGAQATLRRYVEASTDPDSIGYDPVAAHYLAMAKAAPRSTPPPTSRTPEAEAWSRVSAEPGRDRMQTLDRVAELEAEIIAERAAAEEEAE